MTAQEKQNARRLMVIGAHPDDCESVGGIALNLIALGWQVLFLSATNGSAGHHLMPGGALALRRAKEARKVAEISGVVYQILDIEDGKLTTGLPEREQMMRAIRGFNPHVIITHRPNDYHPDHRNTSLLVQDCAYLLAVPGICPLAPPMEGMPAIFYKADRFMKPAPFNPDLVFDVSAQAEAKLLMFHQHTSQMYEWLPWIAGENMASVPQDEASRLDWLRQTRFGQDGALYADTWREALVRKYGDAGYQVKHAEALEACEYGRQLSPEETAAYFPF